MSTKLSSIDLGKPQRNNTELAYGISAVEAKSMRHRRWLLRLLVVPMIIMVFANYFLFWGNSVQTSSEVNENELNEITTKTVLQKEKEDTQKIDFYSSSNKVFDKKN